MANDAAWGVRRLLLNLHVLARMQQSRRRWAFCVVAAAMVSAAAVQAISGPAVLGVDNEGQPGRVLVPLIAADGLFPTPTPTAVPPPTPVPQGPAIYLTFDDGPNPRWTRAILETLARYHALATFFAVGALIDAYPGLVAEAAAAGHAIGTHTYSHTNLARISREQIANELSWGQGTVTREIGRTTTCMRPPYGAVSDTVREAANAQGLTLWMWTVDSNDWHRPGARAIVSSVLAAARPDSIVLLHDGGGDRAQTVEALDSLLAELARQGYRFLPLPC